MNSVVFCIAFSFAWILRYAIFHQDCVILHRIFRSWGLPLLICRQDATIYWNIAVLQYFLLQYNTIRLICYIDVLLRTAIYCSNISLVLVLIWMLSWQNWIKDSILDGLFLTLLMLYVKLKICYELVAPSEILQYGNILQYVTRLYAIWCWHVLLRPYYL